MEGFIECKIDTNPQMRLSPRRDTPWKLLWHSLLVVFLVQIILISVFMQDYENIRDQLHTVILILCGFILLSYGIELCQL